MVEGRAAVFLSGCYLLLLLLYGEKNFKYLRFQRSQKSEIYIKIYFKNL